MTLQEQYNRIQKGKGSKEIFLKEAKSKYPNLVRNAAGFDETSSILKKRNIIAENIYLATGKTEKPDWFDIFNENMDAINEEAKAVEKKPTKEVVDMETKGYDYKDLKNIDNVFGESFLKGYYTEMKNPKNADKTIDEVKEIVAKNLAKDQLHYKKNAMFGVEGLGLEEMKSEEVSGKHKESGYSDKLKTLVKESLMGGVVTTGNPNSISAIQNQVIKDILEENEEEVQEGYGAEEYEKGKAAGEEIEKKKEKKKMKKETIDSKLAEIEAAGKITTLEAQITAIEEVIAQKESRLSLVNEDADMAELLDKGKVNAMRKEIKLLEKRCGKMKKMYEKLNGSAYTAPVIDEVDETPTFE